MGFPDFTQKCLVKAGKSKPSMNRRELEEGTHQAQSIQD